jgi:hypothetical protein
MCAIERVQSDEAGNIPILQGQLHMLAAEERMKRWTPYSQQASSYRNRHQSQRSHQQRHAPTTAYTQGFNSNSMLHVSMHGSTQTHCSAHMVRMHAWHSMLSS